MPKTAKQGGFPNADNGLLRPDANAITDFQSEGPRQFSAGAHGRDAGGGADSGAFKEQIYRLKCRRGLAVRQGRGSGERTGGANADIVERGAIMAATILNSPWATEMSVYVVRAFVRLRQLTASNQRLAAKLAQLEHKLDDHDAAIRDILDAIRQLMLPPDPPKKRQIGFVRDE